MIQDLPQWPSLKNRFTTMAGAENVLLPEAVFAAASEALGRALIEKNQALGRDPPDPLREGLMLLIRFRVTFAGSGFFSASDSSDAAPATAVRC